MRDAYLAHEVEIERRTPAPRYREVLTEGLRRAAVDLSLPLHGDDAGALAVTLPHWPVFPDVRDALTACRDDGWRLALLTNCDRDLIALTRRRLPVPFDAVVTAEDVGAYKPDPAHFHHFRDVLAPGAVDPCGPEPPPRHPPLCRAGDPDHLDQSAGRA